jgi:hypothetical protein
MLGPWLKKNMIIHFVSITVLPNLCKVDNLEFINNNQYNQLSWFDAHTLLIISTWRKKAF